MVPLSAIISELESGVSVNGEDVPAGDSEHGVLKVSCVSDGHFYARENKRVISGELHRLVCSVRRGDLLVTRANTCDLIGASGLVDRDYANLFLPDKVWRVLLKEGSADSIGWLKHVLNSPQVRAELKKRATGTSGSMKNIPQSSFLAINVFRPLPDEQHRIACILDVWDRGIRQLTDLIAEKLGLKQGLMQQLLTGQRRFSRFKGEWQQVQLRDVTTECDERNRGQLGTDSVKAVTKAQGIVPMRERTIGADIDRYLIVQKDWFAYNPMRINIGSIARWGGENDVLVSPDYVVFRCNPHNGKSPGIEPDYLDHLRRSGIWEKYVTAAGNGSVRVRIYYSDLGHLKFSLPEHKEQRRIADVLNAADREICLLQRELDLLYQQKKGLMHKLLTGQRRVEGTLNGKT